MKFKTALHFFAAAMLAFGVTSCGSDKNTTNSGTINGTPTNVSNVTANPGQGALTRDEFYNEVSASRFDKASLVGLYAFKRNGGSDSNFSFNFDFNFCWSNCQEKYREQFQDSVDGYVWRHLQDSQNIRRDFNEEGIVFRGPESDSQFGSTLSGIREGLLTIIRNASSVEKCEQVYQGTENSTAVTFQSGLQVPVLMPSSTSCYRWGSASSVSSGFGGNTNVGQRSKMFRFRYSNKTYIIDLTQRMILNPTAVY